MKCLFFSAIIFIGITNYSYSQKTLGSTRTVNNLNSNFEHEEGSFEEVNGIKMYYEEYGEGEPLLLIHGNGGSVGSFDDQINFFSKKNRVIIADSRAHGRTLNTSDSLTYEMIADDYFLLLDALGIDSANIIGINDGAVVGLLLAIQYPHKVKKLAILSGSLSFDTSSIKPEAIDILASKIKMDKDSIKSGKLKFKNALQLKTLRYDRVNIDVASLQLITCPVMVMGVDHDFVKTEHTLFIYQNIPNSHLCIFPGSTQMIVKESAMVFNNMIVRFFSRPFLLPDEMEGLD